MSNQAEEPSGAQGLDAANTEAQRLLGEIKQFWTTAEQQTKEAEASRKKADSEALFAYQAKGNCETHSTAIATLKATAEADAVSVSTNKQRTEELVSAITTQKTAADADAKTINDSRRAIENSTNDLIDAAKKGTDHLQKIEVAKSAIDDAQSETKTLRDATIQARNKAEEETLAIGQHSVTAQGLEKKITDNHESAMRLTADIGTLATAAKADREALGQVLEHLKNTDQKALSYESELVDLKKKLDTVIKQAEGLLPAGQTHLNSQ